MNLIPGIASTSSALNAERARLEVITQNIANANTTRMPDGQPYQRQQVIFEAVLQQARGAASPGLSPQTVRVARVEPDNQPPRLLHNPSHPDADENGMVAMPNVNIYTEMVDMIAATRSFEANLAVVNNARSMAMQSLMIGKRG